MPVRRPFLRFETDLSRSHDLENDEALKRQVAIKVYYLLCMYVFQLLTRYCVILDTGFHACTILQIAKTRLNGHFGRLNDVSPRLNPQEWPSHATRASGWPSMRVSWHGGGMSSMAHVAQGQQIGRLMAPVSSRLAAVSTPAVGLTCGLLCGRVGRETAKMAVSLRSSHAVSSLGCS